NANVRPVRPAGVLDRAGQPAVDDLEAHRAGTNRTRSPGRSRAGEARPESQRLASVRPISCQPPGMESGYTPVCSPAIPTLPAGTRGRGVALRGVTRAAGRPPR